MDRSRDGQDTNCVSCMDGSTVKCVSADYNWVTNASNKSCLRNHGSKLNERKDHWVQITEA